MALDDREAPGLAAPRQRPDEPIETSSLSPRVRWAADVSVLRSGRASLPRLVGVALAMALITVGLWAVRADAPPASASSGPPASSSLAVIASASRNDTLQPSAAPTASATATPPEEPSPTATTAGTPGPGPFAQQPDTGGSSWYSGWKISYTTTLPGGAIGTVVVSNHGTGTCVGYLEYAHGDIAAISLDFSGSNAVDPWRAEYQTYEPYQGAAEVALLCHSNGWSGYVHTFRLPVQITPDAPWTITGRMAGAIGGGLDLTYTVTDPNYLANEGGCTLDATVPGQAPIEIHNLYWRSGQSEQQSVTFVPADAPEGTVAWSLTCVDMSPQEYQTRASASGSFALRQLSTPSPESPTPSPSGASVGPSTPAAPTDTASPAPTSPAPAPSTPDPTPTTAG